MCGCVCVCVCGVLFVCVCVWVFYREIRFKQSFMFNETAKDSRTRETERDVCEKQVTERVKVR